MHSELQVAVPDASTTKDDNQVMALQARKSLLETAYKNSYKLFGFHFAFPGVGTMVKGKQTAWTFEPLKGKD